jgi:hypothetical protein
MAAALFYMPGRTAIDLNGLVAAGAQITFYATGTTTKQSIFADSGLVTELANPVVANTAGRFPTIYISDALVYRVVGEIPATSEDLFDVDPYYAGSASEADPLTIAAAAAAAASASAAAISEANALAAATAQGVYATKAEGLAAVAEGETFWSDEDGFIYLYRDLSGVAVLIGSRQLFDDGLWTVNAGVITTDDGVWA